MILALLSPAKSLDFETALNTSLKSEPQFQKETLYLASKLKKTSAKKLGDLMGISPALAALNHERYQVFEETPNKNLHRQAAWAFNGDVYRGLEAYTLSEKEQEYLQQHLRILSGLYGYLKPADIIQPYRLEMGCGFKVTPTKDNLYKYWKPLLAPSLNKEEGVTHIVNLASQEYFKSVDTKKLKRPVLHIDFKENKGGTFKTVSFFAKKARGLMARYMAQQNVQDIQDLKLFDLENYTYNDSLSSEDKWIFTR